MFTQKLSMCIVGAYIPSASVSDGPEDRHCVLCIADPAGTLTRITMSPQLRTGSRVNKYLYRTKNNICERVKKYLYNNKTTTDRAKPTASKIDPPIQQTSNPKIHTQQGGNQEALVDTKNNRIQQAAHLGTQSSNWHT